VSWVVKGFKEYRIKTESQNKEEIKKGQQKRAGEEIDQGKRAVREPSVSYILVPCRIRIPWECPGDREDPDV
jgi:hypothetical protein